MFFFLFPALSALISAQIILSSSPITNNVVIGDANLAAIQAKTYDTKAAWANQVLTQCGVVSATIAAIGSSTCSNVFAGFGKITSTTVQAGGFEGVTDPTFVFDIQPSMNAVDVGVLDNAIGYVLSQGGNGRFSLSTSAFIDGFPLNHMRVNFAGTLTGVQAKAFFDLMGSIDQAIYNSNYAGFTQVGSTLWFIQPMVPDSQFVNGLNSAVVAWNAQNQGNPIASIHPDTPTPQPLSVAFTTNNWAAHKSGFRYIFAIKKLTGKWLSDACVSLLEAQRLQALKAAMWFATTNSVPSVNTCQLFTGSLPTINVNPNANCPRNLGCSSCLAHVNSDGTTCSFQKINTQAANYGACYPLRTHGRQDGRPNTVSTCSGADNQLTFPPLTATNLDFLVGLQENKCDVVSINPSDPTPAVYSTGTTITWTIQGGGANPGCQNVISGVMIDFYFGVYFNLVQS